MWRELRFLAALWKANLLAAMEYRVSFISQIAGMMLNNAVYFLFWVIFFDRFQSVRGWELDDMFLLFGIAAAGIGLGNYLFGNNHALADTIAGGRLDYYLSLPRPVLLHVLASRSLTHGLGDFSYGLISFALAGQWTAGAVARFLGATLVAAVVYLSFLVLVQSLAFWLGNASMLGQQALNALVTLALYPITLFDGTAKLLLFTVVPAAFIGAVPAELVREFSWATFAQLLAAAGAFLGLALLVFYRGLRRYESGSAIQTQV